MNRRRFIAGSALASLVLSASWSHAQTPAPYGDDTHAFDGETVRGLARALAEKDFAAADNSLPKPLADISYDDYRAIRFRPDRALWRDAGLPFQVQLFHRGFIFKDRVEIFEVVDGQATRIAYSPDLFDFGKATLPPADAGLGFAGFRFHAPINRPDYFDEVAVFLGASYFRAVGKGQNYGLSARGLSLNTGAAAGEEFPAFRAFWIERPSKQSDAVTVHALLDSKSTTAAHRFTIRPGTTTVFDVDMALYPRVNLDKAGIGTLTSMFFFDAHDRIGVDDFRPAVHDSDGLAIRNGYGEELWRPLTNPRDLQISVFGDPGTRGFGLLQRQRDFRTFQDLESRFETRPSAWVEPVGDFGEGAVHLLEIPTKEEIHDNIVTFWRPKAALEAKQEHTFNYRLYWGDDKPNAPRLAAFTKVRAGAAANDGRLFVIEATGDVLRDIDPAGVQPVVTTDKGEIRNVVLQRNSVTRGWRLSFELHPGREKLAEWRAQLKRGDEALSEVLIYRWTAG